MIIIPRAGRVSNPVNGGAISAKIVNIKTANPSNLSAKGAVKSHFHLGLDRCSNHRTRFRINGIILPSIVLPSRLCFHFFGNQMARKPSIISKAKRATINSRMCVIPPVGIGNAGNSIKSKKTIAKLLSSNNSIRLSIVFGCLLFSHASSWLLKVMEFNCFDITPSYKTAKQNDVKISIHEY